VQRLLDWLAALPALALYASLAGAAAIENVFPPFPADTVVAFGSFIAARGSGSMLGVFVATWLGNMAGAAFMYALGRRYGAALLRGRLMRAGPDAEARIDAMYLKYGLWALAVSRFIPGVRAIVPPFAGALRLSPVRALAAMGVASAIWYGAITVLAFRVGSSWEALQATVARAGTWMAVVATAIALVGVAIYFVRRRRHA
jgi:membrane protein DedA with SNARE-associated domain